MLTSWKPFLMGYRHWYCLISTSPKHEKFTFYIPYIFYNRNIFNFCSLLSKAVVSGFGLFWQCRAVNQEHIHPWHGCRAIAILSPLWREQWESTQLFCRTSSMNVQGKTEQLSHKLTWERVQWSKFTVMRSFNLIPETARNRWGHVLANECNMHYCCQEALV